MGFAISALLMALGILAFLAGRPHVGALVLGLFLAVAAWQGLRELSVDTVRFLDGKRRRSHQVVRARSLVANVDTRVRDVVREFAPDRVHLVYVLDGHGRVVDIVEEREIVDAVFSGKWDVPVGKLSEPAVAETAHL